MLKLDEIQKRLLREVADLHEVPEGAYNIRSNSVSAEDSPQPTSRLFPRKKSAVWRSGSNPEPKTRACIFRW